MPYEMFEHDGQFCLRNQQSGKLVAGSCHADKTMTMAMMRALYANEPKMAHGKAFADGAVETKMVWTTAYVNDLPDSAFLYVESGGSKDSEGKTTPRSLRHFPYKDSTGKVDLAHLRNALARIPQSSLSADVKARVIAKAEAIAKANGVGKSFEDEKNMTESLTYYGGEVKALGDGRIGGYLVLFTPGSPDLQGDFFTKSTDFFIDSGDQRPILYRHGAHPVIKSRQLGKAQVTIDDVGVFIEGELALRDKYEKAIYTLAEKGKLGWSSGSMGHLVTRKPNGKSFEITSWPIGEASLTPNPVEGRTAAIPLKSLVEEDLDFDQVIKSFDEAKPEQKIEFDLAGTPAISRFCEAVAPNSFKDGAQRSAAAADAIKEFITIGRIMGEAFFSDHSRLVRRGEHRFVKSNREIDAATLEQSRAYVKDIEQAQAAFEEVKSALQQILQVSEMGLTQQKALDEQARFELWNFGRITGKTPEELRNG